MIDSIIQPYVERNAFSGVVLVGSEDEILEHHAYGYANQEYQVPNTLETRFHIASLSKPFTAVAILQLVEKGLFDLDTTLDLFLPEIANAEQITIRHLLRHYTGLPNINTHPKYRYMSLTGMPLRELVSFFETLKPLFAPGEKYYYSNTNYNILAFLIQFTTGDTYGEYLTKNILEPLELKNTFHHQDPQEIIPNLATGYEPAGKDGLKRSKYINWQIKTGNGSLISTTTDLYFFNQGLSGGDLVSTSDYRMMKNEMMGFFHHTSNNIDRTMINGRSPGYTARLTNFTDEDLTIIVLSNNYTAVVVDEISGLIAKEFLGFEPELTEFEEISDISKKFLQTRAGQYQWGDDYFVPNLKFNLEVSDNVWNYVVNGDSSPLVPTGEDSFFSRTYWNNGGFEKNRFYFEFNGKKYYAEKIS